MKSVIMRIRRDVSNPMQRGKTKAILNLVEGRHGFRYVVYSPIPFRAREIDEDLVRGKLADAWRASGSWRVVLKYFLRNRSSMAKKFLRTHFRKSL